MKQSKYDEPEFFAKYSQMPRSLGGLEQAAEWPFFRSLLPDLGGKRVLDLGCGYGWHCRHARQHGAARVVGVDLSERMLARAIENSTDPALVYHRSAIEDIEFSPGDFDIVISSLALHYVSQFDFVSRKIYLSLVNGGVFVFSVEHPMLTALADQQWYLGPKGERLHWPVDNYQEEGVRHTKWLADRVIKYHRTVATYVNTLIDSGFRISRLLEPTFSSDMVAKCPDLKDEQRRPSLLMIAAAKPSST
jgi:SAM-dependent methyltransferase